MVGIAAILAVYLILAPLTWALARLTDDPLNNP
jgi:hypothetical protein